MPVRCHMRLAEVFQDMNGHADACDLHIWYIATMVPSGGRQHGTIRTFVGRKRYYLGPALHGDIMSDPDKGGKKEECLMTEQELYEMLLVEDDRFHDEGRDLYMDEVIKKIRKDLETDRDQ